MKPKSIKLNLRQHQIAKEMHHSNSTSQRDRHDLKIQIFVNQMVPKETKRLNSPNTSQRRLMPSLRVTLALRLNMVLERSFEGWREY